MSTTNTLDKWTEYIELQKMIEIVGHETGVIFNNLILLADDYEYDRVDTINMFCEMFDAILEEIDPDEYEPKESIDLKN